MEAINPFESFGLGRPQVDDRDRTELGQEDFMTLMIAQFRNQDPFQPTENGEFLAQLAQFGTVNGIDELNQAFAGLRTSIQSEQALQAANLVGHSVLAETNRGYVDAGGTLAGAVDLDSSASNVLVEITDTAGQLVRRFDLGEQAPGMVRFRWDGRDAGGGVMPGGTYRVNVLSVRGTQVESETPLVESAIESVTLGRAGEGLTLNLTGGGQLGLSSVRQII